MRVEGAGKLRGETQAASGYQPRRAPKCDKCGGYNTFMYSGGTYAGGSSAIRYFECHNDGHRFPVPVAVQE